MTKMSSLNYMELCRLCLVKEKVSVPIFEGEGGERQIFDKIATCLPVKVSQDDKLPKKICSDCVYRVENSYQFWNTTSNSEKQLLEWVVNDDVKVDTKSNLTMETEQLVLKEETIDHDQTAADVAKSLSRVEAVLTEETGQPGGGVSEEEEEEEDSDDGGGGGGGEDSNSEESGEEPPGKEEIESEEEEEEEEPYEELEPTTFVNVSLACDEAGPSGIQQTRQQTKQDSQASAASASATTENAEAPSTSAADPAASGSPSTGRVDLPSREMMNASEASIVFVGFDQEEVPPHPGYISHQVKEVTQKIRPGVDFETMCTGTMDIETITIKSEIFPINEPTDMGVNEEDNLNSYSTEDPKFSKTSINNVKLLTNPIIKVSQTGSSIYTTTTLLNSFPARKIKPKLSYSEVSNNIFTTKRVSCDVCFKSFRYASRLKLHMQTHSKERPELFCDLCSFSTLRKDSLSKHRKRHINENLYVCDICKRSFNERSDLVEHLNVHAGKEPYQCDICGLSFLLGSKLSYHRKIMHGNSGKISCAHCDKEFVHHFEWKMHMQGHKKKKLYTCDYCSRTFTTKNVLKIHIAVHMNIKSFPCKFCSLSFNTGQLLKLHTYSHMAKKPYMCKKCDQTFIQHSAFEAHVNFHTGKRPYTCHICNKGFVRMSNLNSHIKIHLNNHH